MKLKKVINLFGGPNTGKSTLASGLFYKMKINGFSVECPGEYAKDCIFEGRKNLLLEDQLYIFTKQHRKLFRLKDEYEYIIMDSPILLSTIYYQEESFYNKALFRGLVRSTFHNYPNLNFYLTNNGGIEYETAGRYQTQTEANHIANMIKEDLYFNDIEYTDVLSGVELDYFFNLVVDKIKEIN